MHPLDAGTRTRSFGTGRLGEHLRQLARCYDNGIVEQPACPMPRTCGVPRERLLQWLAPDGIIVRAWRREALTHDEYDLLCMMAMTWNQQPLKAREFARKAVDILLGWDRSSGFAGGPTRLPSPSPALPPYAAVGWGHYRD